MPKGGKDRINRAPDLVRLRDVGEDGDHNLPDAAAISAAVPSTYLGVRALCAISAPDSARTWAIPLPMPRPAR